MKDNKEIKHCPIYPRYWADKEGHVYLDPEGKEEVGACPCHEHGHLVTTTVPHILIHRCIFFTFNPDAPDKGYDVHHLNEDKTDNRLDNLQLLSRSEHARLHITDGKHPCYGRTGEKNPNSKPVLQYTKEGKFIAEYPCTREAGRATGISGSHISAVCLHRPKHKTAGGYIWRFKDDPFIPTESNIKLF